MKVYAVDESLTMWKRPHSFCADELRAILGLLASKGVPTYTGIQNFHLERAKRHILLLEEVLLYNVSYGR